MPRCDRCDERIEEQAQWIQLTHNYPRMHFESDFCSAACAKSYLDDGLFEEDLESLRDAD